MDPTSIENLKRLMDYEASRKAPPEAFPFLPDIPGGRYTDTRYFELEQEHIWRKSWLLAAHIDEVPEPGCFRLWDNAGQPVIIVHGEDGHIRAFYNTCSHRGAPVVYEPSGKAQRLVCQYHAWTMITGCPALSQRRKQPGSGTSSRCAASSQLLRQMCSCSSSKYRVSV